MLVGCSARGVPILRRVRLHRARLVSTGNYRGKVGYDPPLPCLPLTDGNPWCAPRVSSARDRTAVASLTHLLTLPVTWRFILMGDGGWEEEISAPAGSCGAHACRYATVNPVTPGALSMYST